MPGPLSRGKRERHSEAGASPSPADLPQSLAELATVDIAGLHAAWRQRCRSEPPRSLGQDLLRRELAYRLQEAVLGGLSRAAQRQIVQVEREARGAEVKSTVPSLKPGTSLVREWHGRTYTVQVLQDGFAYAGQRYATLSEVARQITGAHWSGPRFFGLHRRGRRKVNGQPKAGHPTTSPGSTADAPG